MRQALVFAQSRLNIQRGDAWKAFWAGQQRFFKLLCVSLKVRKGEPEGWGSIHALPAQAYICDPNIGAWYQTHKAITATAMRIGQS